MPAETGIAAAMVSAMKISRALAEGGDETERCQIRLVDANSASCRKRLKSEPNRCVSCNIVVSPAKP
jgi:hypothetical protein